MGKVNLSDTFLRGNILSFKDFVEIDNNIILFSTCNYNGLYKYDWENDELSFLGCFENENILMKSLHSKIIQYNQLYIFIPYYAKEIDIYDIEKDMFYSMELPLPKYECHSGEKFQTATWYKGKLYLLPENYSYILEIDLEQEHMHIYDKWNEEKLMYQPDVECGFGTGCLVSDQLVYLPLKECNKILEFNLESKAYKFITVKSGYKGFQTLACLGNYFYATDKNGKVISFQLNGGNVNIIGEYNTQFYYYIVIEEKYLLLFANTENAILIIDTSSKKCNFYRMEKCLANEEYDNWEYNRLWFVKKVSDRKWALMNREDRALKVFDINIDNKIDLKRERIIFDNTGHANRKIDVAQFYEFWAEYHNEVTKTLGYRKPFIVNEKFSEEDTLQFIFDLIDNEILQGDQMRNNNQNIGFLIWKGLGEVNERCKKYSGNIDT